MTALLLVGIVVALLILRQPLLVILMSVAAYIHIVWGQAKLDYIIEDMWVGLDKEVILSIPLFILCGSVMTRGSIAQRLIAILASVTRPLPGGLAVACVLSCAVFAAISGSSIVTMLAIGSIMYPAMRQAGYTVDPDDHLWSRDRDQRYRSVRCGLRPRNPAHRRTVHLFGLGQPAYADRAV